MLGRDDTEAKRNPPCASDHELMYAERAIPAPSHAHDLEGPKHFIRGYLAGVEASANILEADTWNAKSIKCGEDAAKKIQKYYFMARSRLGRR